MSKSLFDDLIGENEPLPVEQEVEETPVKEEETEETGSDEDYQVDDRVKVLYDILVDTNVIDSVEGFQPTVEHFEELVESLPEHFFMQAVSNLPEHLQVLLEYGMNNPQASISDMSEFFSRYVEPAEYAEPDTDEEAMDYLKPILMENKLFPTEAKVDKYLQELLEEGILLDKAKELFNEYQESRAAEMQEQIEQVKLAKEQAVEQQKEYYAQLYDTVQELDWDKDRKNVILDNLRPDEVQRKNSLIMQSPKAVVQLADIYSYFDEEKGEFDFSQFGIRKMSKKLEEQKTKIQGDKISSHLSNLKTGQQGSSGSFWSSFKPVN